ncbi:peptidylprolyl isomerase [Laedolimicola sp.]|uniref:peptidylprolyl isomerase n=1 Tax=Laedolimicola sp. TaxID=2981663 RepID=UPI003F7FCD75
MIKTIRRGAAALLAAIVLTGSLTGCGTWSNTKIVLTTGLTGDQLFKVGKSVCTLPEAMIYVMDYKQQYENAYGVEMWEHDFGGVTLEEYVKDTIIAQLASVKAVTLLAKENNVTLSDAEKEKISQAAEEYYSALTDEQKKYMKVEKGDVEDLYTAHVLSKKVYTEITKDVNTEVSDDEARIITIQQIRLDSLDNAEIVKARLDEGKDFATVAAAYNRDSQTTVTLGRGEKEAAYEEAAFSLENDQISDVIETTGGYYILKCVNNFDRDATEANKITMVEKRRDEEFTEAYETLMADTPSEFNRQKWTKVHFADYSGEAAPNFMTIYTKYFGN